MAIAACWSSLLPVRRMCWWEPRCLPRMDLPRVTLAVVLAADGLLHRPDLRPENVCNCCCRQRAGRGERPGRVLVQTIPPITR